MPALFDAWTDGDAPVVCLVPDGVAAGALDGWTGGNVPHPGHPFRRGRLSLHAIPFVAQDDYDRLLWLSTVNFVRGEDSFVRAQWAARPFAWHIYPQADGAHWRKLDAFVDRYVAGSRPGPGSGAAPVLAGLERGARRRADRRGLAGFRGSAAPTRRQAHEWAAQRAAMPDLAAGLVKAATFQV